MIILMEIDGPIDQHAAADIVVAASERADDLGCSVVATQYRGGTLAHLGRALMP